MNLKETKTGGITVYKGKILNLEVDDVKLPDGTFSKREIVRHSGGAAVLYVKDNAVLLVKQFRYAYGKEIYEIPAGKLNSGEDPESAAVRELEEETGFRAQVERYACVYPTPGYTDEIIHIYRVVSAVRTCQNLDKGEFLNVEFIPLEKVIEMINSGEIADGKTLVAIYKYLAEQK